MYIHIHMHYICIKYVCIQYTHDIFVHIYVHTHTRTHTQTFTHTHKQTHKHNYKRQQQPKSATSITTGMLFAKEGFLPQKSDKVTFFLLHYAFSRSLSQFMLVHIILLIALTFDVCIYM